jgi:hypothetical protein
MSNDIRTPVPLAVCTESQPRWWVAPLTGTLVAPALAFTVSRVENTFADRPFLLTGSMVLAYALILPSWFAGRTPARGRRRNCLVVSGCAIAAYFPALISALGWTLFVVMLFSGQVDG